MMTDTFSSQRIPPGYRQTEVGVLPEDWEVKAFGKLYQEPSRNGIYKSSAFHGRGTRIVNMGEMFGFEFISNQDMSRVSLTAKETAASGLHDGDLLFGRRSVVPAGAGKCSLVVNPPEPLIFESSIIRVRLDQSGADPLFHYYFFASSTGRCVMSIIVAGTNVKGIRGSELRELKIPHPPLPEQRAIATALSDVDGLLGGLDRLIAKKRDLKQAAVQQLLTGQTRLPGFLGEWEVKTIDQVGFVTSGKRLPLGCSLVEQPTPHPYVRVADMRAGTVDLSEIKYVPENVFPAISRYRIFCDDVFISVAGSLGIVGKVPRELDGANLTENADRITKITCSQDFLLHVLMAPLIQKTIDSIQTVGAQPKLALTRIRKFVIPYPPIPEQTAIAEALTEMDAELAALEQRREKTRALKQAMMQELLTGRTRLISPEEAHA